MVGLHTPKNVPHLLEAEEYSRERVTTHVLQCCQTIQGAWSEIFLIKQDKLSLLPVRAQSYMLEATACHISACCKIKITSDNIVVTGFTQIFTVLKQFSMLNKKTKRTCCMHGCLINKWYNILNRECHDRWNSVEMMVRKWFPHHSGMQDTSAGDHQPPHPASDAKVTTTTTKVTWVIWVCGYNHWRE